MTNKQKRQDYINSLPLRKVPKKWVIDEAKPFIKHCKLMAKHPLRKNFGNEYYHLNRYITPKVLEVVIVKVGYDRNKGLLIENQRLLYRIHHDFLRYVYSNNMLNPKWTVDTRERIIVHGLRFWINHTIPNRFISSKGFVSDYDIFRAEFKQLKSPLWESALKTNKVFYGLWKQSHHSQSTFLKCLELDITNKQLQIFKTWCLKFPNMQLSDYRDFVVQANARGHNIFADNWELLHQRWNEEDARIKEDKKKQIEKTLSLMKKTVFKLKAKDVDIHLRRAKDKNDLKWIGTEMNICVGAMNYIPSEIIVAQINGFLVCIQFKDKLFKQIKTYKNHALPERIEQKLKKEVIKWNSNY